MMTIDHFNDPCCPKVLGRYANTMLHRKLERDRNSSTTGQDKNTSCLKYKAVAVATEDGHADQDHTHVH